MKFLHIKSEQKFVHLGLVVEELFLINFYYFRCFLTKIKAVSPELID